MAKHLHVVAKVLISDWKEKECSHCENYTWLHLHRSFLFVCTLPSPQLPWYILEYFSTHLLQVKFWYVFIQGLRSLTENWDTSVLIGNTEKWDDR